MSSTSAEAPPTHGYHRGRSTLRPQRTGWVTIVQDGQKNVSSRLRLDSWVRQRASLLWKLQTLNDRLLLDLQTEAAMLDPTAVGFAYGGVAPGQVHAKGQLHDAHRVYFSVGLVGRYLLHVRLRQAARPIPGSPFALTVVPGSAFHSTSIIERGGTNHPLVGEVGMQTLDGCTALVRTSDRSSNLCVDGDAKVTVTCQQSSLQASVTDNGDGTYLLHWRSKLVTHGGVDCKVLINNHQIKVCSTANRTPTRHEITSQGISQERNIPMNPFE